MNKKSRALFCLLIFVGFVRPGFLIGQSQLIVPKLTHLEWAGTLFSSHGITSFILNTNSFKKTKIQEERVILLINEQLLTEAGKEITQFIQDLFDEGIDVRPFRLDHKQFRSAGNIWNPMAGIALRDFVADAYRHVRMDQIPSRKNRGLILLGAFPAMFINWHQEDTVPVPPSWANLTATNDYLNVVIRLQWNPPPGPKKVDHYQLKVHQQDPGVPVMVINNIIPGFQNQDNYKPRLRGQNSFQFEIQAVFDDQTFSPPALSNTVNWNFLINCSDYLLADVDGFQIPVKSTFPYMQDARTFFGIDADPALVVTQGVKANPVGYELSPADKTALRNYAQTEMYYGRIDAYSLGRGRELPKENEALFAWEAQSIREYLWRDHLWRKSKLIRDQYNEIYLFRSADFVGGFDDKVKIRNIWKQKPEMIKRIVLEDAKKDVNCLDDTRPEVTLYADINYQGASITLNDNADDLSRTAIGNSRVSSLKIDLKGGSGGVALFRQTGYGGIGEIFIANVPDLRPSRIGDNLASSVRVLNCTELNSPSWDCTKPLFWKLKGPWRVVDLGAHGNEFGFVLSSGVRCLDTIGRTWDDRAVKKEDIWNLDGGFKFLVNHCCHNGQFMAPGNVGTSFLFNNKTLAEWGWSGSGTTEHEILHESLRDGDRFGAAVMKNYDGQMAPSAANANPNPWRSYFTVVLGDPTLRVFYEMPDLYIRKLSLASETVMENTPFVVELIAENKGDRMVDPEMAVHSSWQVFPVKGTKAVLTDVFSVRPLKAGEAQEIQLEVGGKLAPGDYELRILIDDQDLIREADENDNQRSANFKVVADQRKKRGSTVRFGLKGGGSYSRTSKPLFIHGEVNTEASRREYPYWQEFGAKNGLSWNGGFNIEFMFTPSVSLETGVLYDEVATRTEIPRWIDYYDELTFQTLGIPLFIKTNVGSEKFGLYLGGGFQAVYILALKDHYHFAAGTTVDDYDIGGDAAAFGKKLVEFLESPWSYSGLGALGLRLGPLTIEARYLFGLKDVILSFPNGATSQIVNAGKLQRLMGLLGFSF